MSPKDEQQGEQQERFEGPLSDLFSRIRKFVTGSDSLTNEESVQKSAQIDRKEEKSNTNTTKED